VALTARERPRRGRFNLIRWQASTLGVLRSRELVAAPDAPRSFGSLLEKFRKFQAQRFVIVFRNRPQAVLVHVAEYERLVRAACVNEHPAA
jgi:hypothetical protein